MSSPSGSSPSRAAAIIEQARRHGCRALDEPLAKRVLSASGLRVPKSAIVKSRDEVAPALDSLQGPLVLKLVSPDVLHKSDFGGVKLGMRHASEVLAGMDDMAKRCASAGFRLDGFLLEEMAPPGHELVVGGFRDPSFGQVIMLGLGGVFVEILRDIAFRICPITPWDAQEMLDELQGAALLRGARGGVCIPDAVITDVLLAIGGENGLLTRFADSIAELDINPLIVSAQGAVAVDARMILCPEGEPS
jgi:acetyl-CoA synthetase (ADP-forming)